MSQHLESLLGAQRRAECAKNDAAAAASRPCTRSSAKAAAASTTR
jgi:hypothetical protein